MTLQASTFAIELHGRRYTARWAQLGTVEQLRVNLRVEAEHNGAQRVHVETFDLYSTRSRSVFAGRVAKLCDVANDIIEEEIAEILMAVDKAQREVAASTAPVGEAAPSMSDAERAEALEMLRSPDLIERIAKDMEALGYVGEDINKKLGYLIAVSRKLDEPLSAIIISQSGAGKSGLASVLEHMTAPEELVFWSRLTPQALYYVEKDFLRRKLVVIEERDGSDAADYSIRALQSKHKLVQAVPVKDPATGAIKTRTMEVEGPAAFLETTTRLHINPENASRCFELYLDESRAQTERVQEAQRKSKTAEGREFKVQKRAIMHRHHNAQRLLEPVQVVIPYAPLLTFPASWLRTRRDNFRLLNLIEACAFLHQHQRPRRRDAHGEYIEANDFDYAVAYALASRVLGLGLDELKKPAREMLAIIELKANELASKQGSNSAAVRFTQREVRDWSGLPHHQVKIAMAELVELEYIEAERSARGGKNLYRIAPERAQAKPLVAGLITPLELFNRVQEVAKAPPSKSRVGKVGNGLVPLQKTP